MIMTLIRMLVLGLFAVLAAAAASLPFAGPATKPSRRQGRKPPTTTDEKLQALIELRMTSAEIAVGSGCSVRAIKERRAKLNNVDQSDQTGRYAKADKGIDDFYSLTSMLQDSYMISPENTRAWFSGRSAYLDEQRPAQLLGAGEFELVREAAIAYATNETPEEFRDRIGTITRVPDPLEA
jgi:hypothetical protein